MDINEYISSGIIESYVLGLATEQEASLLECVRMNHPEVEQAIREAEETLEEVATIQAITPADGLKEEIWNKINNAPSLEAQFKSIDSSAGAEAIAEDQDTNVSTMPRTIRRNFAIAASVLLVASAGVNIYLYQNNQRNQDDLVVAETKLADRENQLEAANQRWTLINKPSVKSITLAGTPEYVDLQAKVYWDTDSKAVYLLAENLPTAAEGTQYQLWAIVDGQPVDAGLIPTDQEDEMYSMHTISSAQAFAITLEKSGGSPTPTLTELRVIGNI